MTIYYEQTPFTDVDNNGVLTVSSAKRKAYGNAPTVYSLGKTDKGYAYSTDPDAELAPVSLVTLADMADRIHYLTQTPAVYGRDAKLAVVEAALRAFTAPVVTAPPAPPADPTPPNQEDGPTGADAPPPTSYPMGPATGKLAVIPGWEIPNNGVCVTGGETSAGPVGSGVISNIIAWGVHAVRFAIRSDTIYPKGPISTLTQKPNIGPANADTTWWINTVVKAARLAEAADVAYVLDNHTYRQIDDPDLGAFWATFGVALKKAFGGKLPVKFGIEIVNEPKSNWAGYAKGLQANIKTIRDAGVDCPLFLDHGFYSKFSEFPKAMALLDEIGGPEALDPLNKIIFILHDYPTPSGNDNPAKIKKGIDVRARYAPIFDEARRRKVCVVMGEIGMGGGNGVFLPAEAGGTMDGQGFVTAYNALAREYSDVLKGTWCWAAGRVGVAYPFRVNAMTDGPHSLLIQDLWKHPTALQ